MSTQSKIQQAIETGFRPRLKDIQAGHDEQLPGLTELANQLVAAARKPDAAKIKQLLETLKPQLEYAGKLVTAIRGLKSALEKINLKGASADDVKLVTQIKEDVGGLETKLQRNFGKLKGVEDEANDALDKIEQSSGKMAGDWAVLEGSVRDHLADAKTRLPQSAAEFDKFEKARADRNRAGMDKARESLAKLVTGTPAHAQVQSDYEKFVEKSKGHGLDQHAQDQLTRELPGLKKSLDEAAAIETKISKFNTNAHNWGFPPVDGASAAKALKITARSAIPKIVAALNLGSPGMETALDALAKDKEVKSKMTGKQMVAELRKAKVI